MSGDVQREMGGGALWMVLFKLGECYAELQRTDEADRIFRTLVAHYADSEFAARARRQLATNLP